MERHPEATPARTDLTYDGPRLVAASPAAERRVGVDPRDRAPAMHDGVDPQRLAWLCLRCHDVVLRQPTPARDDREPAEPLAANGGLIVPGRSGLPIDAVHRRLSRSRRRAQQAARRAIGADQAAD